ncbi:MAG: phosphopantothenoylcysteine decarboxylase, partial [Cyclobacteriaceae bacterium]|nr:phosphopantothenoylcysteine decarboxylase [Cyclobacteriaceae bacterium]
SIQRTQHPNIILVKVQEALEMYEQAAQTFADCDIAIFAAAVADYTPVEKSHQKIKKKDQDLQIKLTRTKDIARELGKLKKSHQITVGFALETENEESNAQKKLQNKNLDFIVLNSLNDQGAGFAHDTNRISIIDSDNNSTKFELKSKKEVAHDIAQYLLKYL